MTKKLVLDLGHGGTDQGAAGLNISEAVANEIVGYRIKRKLEEKYIVNVILTRANNSTFPTLSERTQLAIAEAADAFVSIHYNKFDGTAHGFESFRHTNSDTTSIDYALQNAIHTKVAAVCTQYGVSNRGLKQADYQVLRDLQNTGIPAVLLEGLFLDSTIDIEFFMTNYTEDYVTAVSEGIAEYLQLPLIGTGTPTTTTIDFVGKVKGDGDNSRIIRYTGSYQTIVSPSTVVAEVGGGYAGAATAGDGLTCYYSIAGGTAGRHVQFDFAFNLDAIGTRAVLLNSLTQIQFNEKVSNTTAFPRNAKQKLYVWNVTTQAWDCEVVKADETVDGYLQLTLTANFADYIDASNDIQFAVLSYDGSDANDLRVQTDHVYLDVTVLA